ncbi:MAG: glycosyltransferase family 2 protein [Armatimonadota bacterium]|nr:glycosyltransferase family 2 protein [Armatimonadota bacterium]
MTCTVVVPSFRRPDDLLECVASLFSGARVPDQVVIVLRDTDQESQARLAAWQKESAAGAERVESVAVSEPGQMAAMNAGLAVAWGDVVCFIDDDCRATRHWLERIMSHYQVPEVVGVGGRDIVHHGGEVWAEPAPVVGRITWYGRLIGNHHQPAFEAAREVDHLKGANMSFRRHVMPQFDTNIRAGLLNDTDVSLTVGAKGKLIYDPLATVHHYPARREGQRPRGDLEPETIFLHAHDWAYVLFKHLSPMRRIAFWIYAIGVGQAERLGLVKLLGMLLRRPGAAWGQWWATVRGIWAGWCSSRGMRRGGTEDFSHRGH